MTEPLTPAEMAALDRALALGTRREAPAVPARLARPDDPAPELTALAFAAHQRRITRLPPRARTDAIRAPDDPRPPMPEALRPAFRRLLGAARLHHVLDLLRPVAWLLRDRGARLHPFDTDAMRLDEMAPCRGPFEAWLAGRDEPAGASDVDWIDLGTAARAEWLRARRAADPAAARALLAGVWGGEKAEVRTALLEALQVGLSADDLPFLEPLASDRSAKVKALAARLVAAVPGTPAHAARLDGVVKMLKVERPWLVGRAVLTVAKGAKLDEAYEVLSETDPIALIARLGAAEDVLSRVADDAADLLPALALGALRFRRFGTLDTLLAQALARRRAPLGPDWVAALRELPASDRPRALRVVVDGPLPETLAAEPPVAEAWIGLLDGPLPAAGSVRMRSSAPYAALLARLAETPDAARDLARIAPLVPPDDAPAAHAQLAANGPLAAAPVQQLWRLLADLDAALPPNPRGDSP